MTTTVDPENSATGVSGPKTTRPEDERIEGTVFTPRQVGMLKVAVVVMGVMLLAGLAAVIAGMIFQASKVGKKSPDASAVPAAVSAAVPAAVAPEALALPPGAEVVSMSLDGERLALHVRAGDDAEIVVVDLRTGNVVSRVKIDKGEPPAQ